VTPSPARIAADVAAVLPHDDLLAQLARRRLTLAVREQELSMVDIDPRDVQDVQIGGRLRDAAANPPDRRETSIPIGTRLRDAAVDPAPGDYRAPVNAGLPGEAGNPHGPNVYSIEVD
jgi:hypothetical protein